MKALAIALFLAILAGALISAHQHKPFGFLVDDTTSRPAVWPAQARNTVNRPMMFVCKPAIFTIGPDAPKPIVRT